MCSVRRNVRRRLARNVCPVTFGPHWRSLGKPLCFRDQARGEMMTARHMADQRTFSHILILALAIGAATGWGMWFLSGQRSDRVERDLRQQVSTLAQSQMRMLHERETAEAAKSDLA